MTDPNTDEALVALQRAEAIIAPYRRAICRWVQAMDRGDIEEGLRLKHEVNELEHGLVALLSQPPSGGWDEQEVARRSAMKLNAWVGDTIRRADTPIAAWDDTAVERERMGLT